MHGTRTKRVRVFLQNKRPVDRMCGDLFKS